MGLFSPICFWFYIYANDFFTFWWDPHTVKETIELLDETLQGSILICVYESKLLWKNTKAEVIMYEFKRYLWLAFYFELVFYVIVERVDLGVWKKVRVSLESQIEIDQDNKDNKAVT